MKKKVKLFLATIGVWIPSVVFALSLYLDGTLELFTQWTLIFSLLCYGTMTWLNDFTN